jgi:fumarate reductase subunit C
MISMAAPTIIPYIESGQLGLCTMILLSFLISAVEIINANPDNKSQFIPFIKTSIAIIIPLLSVFAMIIITKAITGL